MIKELITEFKSLVWPKKGEVINNLIVVSIIAIILMIIVLLMDVGTRIGLEKLAMWFS